MEEPACPYQWRYLKAKLARSCGIVAQSRCLAKGWMSQGKVPTRQCRVPAECLSVVARR